MESHHYSQTAEKTSTEWARRRRPLITLTPLVDVVFILLVFFMLASNFLDWRVLTLAAPAVGVSDEVPKRSLLVRVQADGALELNGEPLSLDALARRTAELVASGKRYRFLVQPGRGVRLQRLVTVVDVMTASGALVALVGR